MLHSVTGFLLAVFFTFLLASCASIDEDLSETDFYQETTATKSFAAWDTSKDIQINRAAKDLLQQSDVLIENREMERASDKLERLLSIDPGNAQAWSRLSWLALQDNKLNRTQQMAQRSNSHASSNNQLKILNWTFIRAAAQRSGDVAVIRKAEKMIDSLNNSSDSL